ncbi:MAG TPA: M2 family metallopeptidase [Gemmatimonadaceae bacterium]|nr:M2 family metallopeptidase [Gemmatimonadaceae bacterium]
MRKHALTLAAAVLLPLALPAQTKRSATASEAQAFIQRAEAQLTELALRANQAGWVAATYITDDTEALNAEASKNYAVAVQKLALDARRFDKVKLSPALRRKFTLLRLGLAAPPPGNPGEAAELTRITTSMEADYGKGTYCRARAANGTATDTSSSCLQISELSRILVDSRDPAALLDAWQGWHRVGAPMRQRYARFVELSNKGARELGFANAGAMWRSNYDMPPDEFAKEVDRLWEQVKPLYLSLHAYVRSRLVQQYGAQAVPPSGMIPAHLLGNMWAQEWGNIYPLVAPAGGAQTYDIGALLKAKNTDVKGMVKYGEGFFTSLGFAPLPATFWERSQFTKPRDREVVCHASAWDIDDKDDVRVKMCLDITSEDFVTAHHELGHNFYQRAYKTQPFLFKGGANDGFHEAIGDAIALSITPNYLQQVGLLDASKVPGPEADIPLLLRQAMDKVAFLPFGLLVDKWRWQVFSGQTTPANYNKAWWDLRAQYQGVAPPVARSEADFDPGAKYHVPANTPYMRYFLARVLQFQFYRSLCQASGYKGPLHRCSFYGSKEAGAKLNAMLEAGQSEPWPETLYKLTGSRQLDATAITEYFAPLKTWLDQQNQGKPVGW